MTEQEFEHEEDLEMLDGEEYWFVKLSPFVISFTIIYILYEIYKNT